MLYYGIIKIPYRDKEMLNTFFGFFCFVCLFVLFLDVSQKGYITIRGMREINVKFDVFQPQTEINKSRNIFHFPTIHFTISFLLVTVAFLSRKLLTINCDQIIILRQILGHSIQKSKVFLPMAIQQISINGLKYKLQFQAMKY